MDSWGFSHSFGKGILHGGGFISEIVLEPVCSWIEYVQFVDIVS